MSQKRQTTATLDEPTPVAEPLTLVLPPDVQDDLPDDRDQLPTVLTPLTLPVVVGDYTLDQPEPAVETAPQEPMPAPPPANDVQLVGRVVHRKKDKQSSRFTKLHKGGTWLEYTLAIDEVVAAGVVETTQIPFLIPSGRHDLERSLRKAEMVRVHGRLDRDAEFDTRYGKQSTQGGTIKERVFIKAGSVEVFAKPNEPAMHAVLRVSGTVRRLVQVARTLGRHDTQKFHIVSILVVERYPRQAPATGMVTYEQTVQVAVPVGDTATLRMLLRPGNPVALELGYRLINDWVSDTYHSMKDVDPTKRDWLRNQSHEHLTVTQATPLDGAEPLEDAEIARMLANARAQQKKQDERRRQQRAKAAAAAQAAASPAL